MAIYTVQIKKFTGSTVVTYWSYYAIGELYDTTTKADTVESLLTIRTYYFLDLSPSKVEKQCIESITNADMCKFLDKMGEINKKGELKAIDIKPVYINHYKKEN